ncbi:MAG: hypothetical protein EOP84_19410 [Verrucomicrobiaceae bacterium]|nr:MAG: hypothetical protein EOP84_19410 [Verrucomicrobiaceae bacterium]
MPFIARFIFIICILARIVDAAEMDATSSAPIRVGVLSGSSNPAKNTSQGLYIKILKEAGMDAGAVSAQMVKEGALEKLDVFVIGGGSGTAFNKSLGHDGGEKVEAFVKAGGGVVGSCAGGYSFVRGHNEALRYIEIANAVCIDTEGGRWARGSGEVQIAPEGEASLHLKIYYANGPLWKITDVPGFGQTVSLAHFVTDVKKKGDPGGVMPGTPAILAGTFGNGRYVLFSAHPEFKRKYGNNPMVVDAARWAARGKLATEERINFRSVFPSMIPEEAK